MTNIIIIDTNIYRQLGVFFYKHIDYKSLEDYCYSSGSEILVTNTVFQEYLDFYKKEVIEKNTLEVERAYEKMSRLESFKKIKKPNFTKQSKLQINLIKKKLTEYKLNTSLDFLLNEADLLKFLIENKHESRKDNTRDYLIWLNVLAATKRYHGDRIILISDDKIFSENTHFLRLKEKHGAKQLEIYASISSFLSVYGYTSNKITKSLILESIPVNVIKEELLKDKDVIPGYISNFYYYSKKKFKLEKFEIQEVKVNEFYSHKDLEDNLIKIIAHVDVKVNFIFAPERNKRLLQKHLETAKSKDPYKMETFDENWRPIYNDYILFHFSLTYSESSNSFTEVKYLDFFPDEYHYRNILQALSNDL